MGIRQDLATLKTLASQGGELLLLRLRVLQMDANEQLRGVLVIVALITSLVLVTVGNIWLFFSVAAAGVPVMWLLLRRIPRIWQRDTAQVQQTLAALQQDLAAFSGSLKTAGFRQKPQTGEARDAE